MTDVTMPSRYYDQGDRLEVYPTESQPGDPALTCLRAAQAHPEGATTHAHVHVHRDALLEALDARERGPRLRATVEALAKAEQERDAARENAAEAERKHGEMVGRLAAMTERRDRAVEHGDQYRRQRDAARTTLAEVEQQRDAAARAQETIDSRLEDLPRLERLLKREQDQRVEAENLRAAADRGLEATRKVSDERGNVLDRIASALGCEPGDEVVALHRRIQTLSDANRYLAERNQRLEAAPLGDVAAHMTVVWGGATRDVVVSPTRWEARLAVRAVDDDQQTPALAVAERSEDGTWYLRPEVWAVEPYQHQGRRYQAPSDTPWQEVRDRLGTMLAVAAGHHEGDMQVRQAAMAALESIAAGANNPGGFTPLAAPVQSGEGRVFD